MFANCYQLAKIGFDTAETGLPKDLKNQRLVKRLSCGGRFARRGWAAAAAGAGAGRVVVARCGGLCTRWFVTQKMVSGGKL